VAAELTAQDLVVVLIPDSGRGYLSRVFNNEWMARYGFLRSEGPVVGDVLAASAREVPPLVYVQPGDRVRRAIDLMHEHDVSQLPVAKGEMPLAAAEVMGSVDELHLMESAFGRPAILDRSVEEVMSAPLPTIGVGQPIELAVQLLDLAPALLVLDGGRPRTVLARFDVLSFLSSGGSRG
jgi:cystathionine beta-synthase